MHEMSLVSSILEVIKDKIKEYRIEQVVQVKLMVGEMTGVEDMTMISCFELLAEDTPAKGAKMVIERIPVKGKCRECGTEFIIEGRKYECPECGNTGVSIVSGKELYIDSIEAE